MLEYSIVNVVANGLLKIEGDEHPLYWVKGWSSLSALVFNKKAQNQLILYLQGQKQNLIRSIDKIKEP